ncbi:13099_t:CDS:2 [Funneliformis caledonium]|uniref:13099_t:CDS:1 n=1 Tax=Funneliformis caledonium TaxID=1117310 RepID=A0A9N9F0D8_9GLOM|nr:13099_t:CDS:2 [Funneliformis caledonium]
MLSFVSGAPIRNSNSYWVFWYYNNNGSRNCGNFCYIVFILVGLILLCICGCGCLRCYLIRKQYSSERLESNMNTQQILDQWQQELQMTEMNHQNQIIAQQQLQYPPLAHTNTHNSQYPSLIPARDITPPPYNNNTFNEEIHKHALRQESNWTAYKAGKQFTRENPPNEILPPQDHSNYIKELGGVEAWKLVPESSIVQLNIVNVTDDFILSFHAKLDAMVQSNYPLIDMKYSADSEIARVNNSSSCSISSTNSITSPSNNNNSRKKVNSNRLTLNTNRVMDSTNLSDSSNISPITTHSKSKLLSSRNSPSSPTNLTILTNPNKDTTIAVGLATKPYPTFRLPGWNNHSVGYHSNEGKRFHNDGLSGRKYAEKWGEENDVIGCGYYPNTGQVFFTKNGINMGIICTGVIHIWFPTIGSDGVCSLKVNFGQEEFIYKPADGMSVAGVIPKVTDQNVQEKNYERKFNLDDSKKEKMVIN